MSSLSLNLLLALSLFSVGSLRADDWPQWGGHDPGRNMYSSAKGFPSKFGPSKPDRQGRFTVSYKPNSEEVNTADFQNLKWVVKLGSQTYGNPVVANGKVLVGTNNATPRDARFKDDRSILMCFDEYTGE